MIAQRGQIREIARFLSQFLIGRRCFFLDAVHRGGELGRLPCPFGRRIGRIGQRKLLVLADGHADKGAIEAWNQPIVGFAQFDVPTFTVDDLFFAHPAGDVNGDHVAETSRALDGRPGAAFLAHFVQQIVHIFICYAGRLIGNPQVLSVVAQVSDRLQRHDQGQRNRFGRVVFKAWATAWLQFGFRDGFRVGPIEEGIQRFLHQGFAPHTTQDHLVGRLAGSKTGNANIAYDAFGGFAQNRIGYRFRNLDLHARLTIFHRFNSDLICF